ncbi:hypothetical protein V6L77_22690 [Pannonibacter sp. Pt2-lr]
MELHGPALLSNARLVTLPETGGYGLVERGAVAIRDGRIEWAGAEADLPAAFTGYSRHDLEGRLVTPAFIDCHTHLIHGGHRAREFEMRLEGRVMKKSPAPVAVSSRPCRPPAPPARRSLWPLRCRALMHCWPKAWPWWRSSPAMASTSRPS